MSPSPVVVQNQATKAVFTPVHNICPSTPGFCSYPHSFHTAMRQTWEEIGLDLAESDYTCVGQLDDREITTSLGKRLLMILSPFGQLPFIHSLCSYLISPSFPATHPYRNTYRAYSGNDPSLGTVECALSRALRSKHHLSTSMVYSYSGHSFATDAQALSRTSPPHASPCRQYAVSCPRSRKHYPSYTT
jgi:hypothetical protein